MLFPCLKCIKSSFSSLLWGKPVLKRKAGRSRQKKKQPFNMQASKSNCICKLPLPGCLNARRLCPEICPYATPPGYPRCPSMPPKVTELATLLMCYLCQILRMRPDSLKEISEDELAQWFSNCVLCRTPGHTWNPLGGHSLQLQPAQYPVGCMYQATL